LAKEGLKNGNDGAPFSESLRENRRDNSGCGGASIYHSGGETKNFSVIRMSGKKEPTRSTRQKRESALPPTQGLRENEKARYEKFEAVATRAAHRTNRGGTPPEVGGKRHSRTNKGNVGRKTSRKVRQEKAFDCVRADNNKRNINATGRERFERKRKEQHRGREKSYCLLTAHRWHSKAYYHGNAQSGNLSEKTGGRRRVRIEQISKMKRDRKILKGLDHGHHPVEERRP